MKKRKRWGKVDQVKLPTLILLMVTLFIGSAEFGAQFFVESAIVSEINGPRETIRPANTKTRKISLLLWHVPFTLRCHGKEDTGQFRCSFKKLNLLKVLFSRKKSNLIQPNLVYILYIYYMSLYHVFTVYLFLERFKTIKTEKYDKNCKMKFTMKGI